MGNRKLWRISLLLLPDEDDIPPVATAPDVNKAPLDLDAFSAYYDLPSVEALVKYFHTTAGFPVKDTWHMAQGYQGRQLCYMAWSHLYKNAAKYCPAAVETSKGHMAQPRQNVRSTKPKQPSKHFSQPIVAPEAPVPDSDDLANELHVKSYHLSTLSKLYTDDDDCGRFPLCVSAGEQLYHDCFYHHQSNTILSAPFSNLVLTSTAYKRTTPSCNASKTVICWWICRFSIMKQARNTSGLSRKFGVFSSN